MSKLNNVHDDRSIHERAVADIQGVMARAGGIVSSADVTSDLISLESLDPGKLAGVQASYKEVVASLKDTATFAKVLGAFSPEQQEIALEAAAMTLMAGGNPAAWHHAAKAPVADKGVKLVNPNQGGLDYANDYSTEGFDSASANQFIPQSAYVNALAAIQGGFEETFFPIQIVPAGTTGVDVSVSIPKIYSAKQRTANGTPIEISKINIVKAIVDSSVLENNSTEILPVSTDNTNPAKLVAHGTAAGNVATVTRKVEGYDITTRPLLVGTEVDLIGISSSAILLQGGILNETDTLDSVVNVGKLFVGITLDADGAGAGAAVPATVAFDVSGQPGSLLQKAAEGSDRLYFTTFKAKMILTEGFTDVRYFANDAARESAQATLWAAVQTAAPGAVKVQIESTITANVNTEFATMEVLANNTTVTAAYDADGNPLAITDFLLAGSSYVVTGYQPKARRTNANIRSRGTIVDSTTVVNYRFPVPMQSPIISQQPINGVVNTSIEGLAHCERIRNSNNAVKTILALEEVLAAGNGLPVGSPTMGAELVVPTYAYHELDLEGIVVRITSKDSMDDLRGALQAAIITITDKLIQDSQYLAALEFMTGNNQDYEVIIVTDCRLYPWLMESGDSRTLGANRKYKITYSLNSKMYGRIYVSLRRATRDGQMNPLDFGTFLYTPALTHEVQVSRAGATVKEIHTVPRNAFYATLPVLGRIDVTKLVELFAAAE